MHVSLVLTVLNEAEHIRRLFDSILIQTRMPDEVVVCDAGSSDQTLSILYEYSTKISLRTLVSPGTNISAGRNIAISAAESNIIAVTDSGVRLDPNWLAQLVEQLEKEEVKLAAGFYVADPETVFETAMGATVLPALGEIDAAKFLPSSRSVAFWKTVWEEVGGYPEWLNYSEDVVFDLRVREKFGPFAFTPQATVYFRPRGSLGVFAQQYYNYAMGDGRAGLFPHIHFIRYFSYLVVLPLLILASVVVSRWMWILAMLAGISYTRLPLMRLLGLWGDLSFRERAKALLLLPVIRVVGDCAKMVGYPVGVWDKWMVR